MTLYVISYDQHKDRDYTPIWTKLRDEWSAKRVLESVWLVNVQGTASQVRDALRATTASEDSLAVIELKVGSDWACYAAQNAGLEWLRQNIHA